MPAIKIIIIIIIFRFRTMHNALSSVCTRKIQIFIGTFGEIKNLISYKFTKLFKIIV